MEFAGSADEGLSELLERTAIALTAGGSFTAIVVGTELWRSGYG